MRTRQIEAFRAVMMSGGVTAAAKMLHISQPSVSRLIADLELSVGFALFERRHGKIHPTSQAQALFDAVRRSFIGLDLLSQAARGIRAHPTGTLRIAALPALAVTLLPEALKLFGASHPEMKVTIETLNQHDIEDRMFLGQSDLGIGVATNPREGIRTSPLALADYVCALPKGHDLTAKAALHIDDLADVTFIGPLHEADNLWRGIDDAIVRADVAVNRRIETQHSMTAYALVEAGLGIAVVEPFSATLFSRLGVAIRPLHPAISVEFLLLEPDIGPSSHLVVALSEAMRQVAQTCLHRFSAGSG